MPADTYSDYLGALLQGTGNNNNNWGVLLNSAITLFDKAIAGKSARTVTGGTLDLDDTIPPAGEHGLPEMVVYFTGTLASNQIVLVPNTAKVWLVYNGTSGSFTLKFKTAAGTASTAIPQGSWQWIACDGADGFALIGPGSDATGANLKVVPTVEGAAIVPIGTTLEFDGVDLPTGFLFNYGQAVSRTTYALLFAALTKATTATKNGTTTLSSVAVDLQNKGLIGAYIEGTGINVGTTITAITATTITLSAAASGSGSIDITILPHGQGDGSTTFNVPDDRNYATVGRGDMGGSDAGRIVSSSDFLRPNTIGATGGSYTHVLTTPQMPNHAHTATDSGHTHTGTTIGENQTHTHDYSIATYSVAAPIGAAVTVATGNGTTGTGAASNSHTHAFTTNSGAAVITVNATGGGGAHNNVQPSRVKNKIIYTGLTA